MQLQDILFQLVESGDYSLDRLRALKSSFSALYKLQNLPSNVDLLRCYRELLLTNALQKNILLEQLLKKRKIRSLSGIVAIQVLTKPFWCPGQCIFCPNDPTMPKSYIKTEPGAARALLNAFDPVRQVNNRLDSLYMTGHTTDKIEMIVLGGTWDVYPHDYKISFIKGLYDACNTNPPLTPPLSRRGITDLMAELQESMLRNETADHRIIGLTIETRPEYVTHENCTFWRSLGVTRLEMGVQSLFDEVLEANKRGHTVQQIREACHTLRQWGFKFSVHVMPGLYQSTYEKDLETFKRLYTDPFLKPDEIKFYPTSVIPGTELANLYHEGKYIPLTTDEIKNLIEEVLLTVVPPYTRIKRLIRDIPSQEIVAGSTVTNLHQLVETDLLQRDRTALYERLQEYVVGDVHFDTTSSRSIVSLDTRSREMRHRKEGLPQWVKLIERTYESSVGQEYFLSFEDELGYIYGFTRLLLPQGEFALDVPGLGQSTAIIRELHVYGEVEGLKIAEGDRVQHTGIGKQLMQYAQDLAQKKGYTRLSVISGIGVRGYYKKLGYELEGTYMVKNLL